MSEEDIYSDEYESQTDYSPQPDLSSGMMGGQTISQDQSFMRQMFNFRKEVLDPLLHAWRGHEYDFEKDRWYVPKGGCFPIMNERGISWGISLLNSYINAVFTVSNFDEKYMNYVMRTAMNNVIANLCFRYEEFNLKKTDIINVFKQIESKILAILLGARGDGYRQFFSKQYQVHEQINNNPQMQQRSGLLSGISSIFKGQQR